MKNKEAMLYGIIGLLGGSLLTLLLVRNAVNSDNIGMMNMMGLRTNNQQKQIIENENDSDEMNMDSSMQDMMESMEGKESENFDEAFLKAMIIHHEGAIDMANEAVINSQHNEIKQMADEIIDAQSKEIEMMKSWQKQWGY